MNISLLLATSMVMGHQQHYRPSSRAKQQGKIVRIDSREFYISDDKPIRKSKLHKEHERTPKEEYIMPIPAYRQESTVGFGVSDRDPAQNIDLRDRSCDRKEGQRWENWIMWIIGCCSCCRK